MNEKRERWGETAQIPIGNINAIRQATGMRSVVQIVNAALDAVYGEVPGYAPVASKVSDFTPEERAAILAPYFEMRDKHPEGIPHGWLRDYIEETAKQYQGRRLHPSVFSHVYKRMKAQSGS